MVASTEAICGGEKLIGLEDNNEHLSLVHKIFTITYIEFSFFKKNIRH